MLHGLECHQRCHCMSLSWLQSPAAHPMSESKQHCRPFDKYVACIPFHAGWQPRPSSTLHAVLALKCVIHQWSLPVLLQPLCHLMHI